MLKPPGAVPPYKLEDIRRFVASLRVSSNQLWQGTHCWVRLGYELNKDGYGSFKLANGKEGGIKVLAHRFSWRVFRGVIPVGHDINHKCLNRKCLNPDHLEPMLRADNVSDSNERRQNDPLEIAGETCPF